MEGEEVAKRFLAQGNNMSRTKPQPIERISYGVNESSVLLGVSPDLIRKWVRCGQIASTRVGVNRKILIPRAELERVLRGEIDNHNSRSVSETKNATQRSRSVNAHRSEGNI